MRLKGLWVKASVEELLVERGSDAVPRSGGGVRE